MDEVPGRPNPMDNPLDNEAILGVSNIGCSNHMAGGSQEASHGNVSAERAGGHVRGQDLLLNYKAQCLHVEKATMLSLITVRKVEVVDSPREET
ncbi:hypothetical protein ACLOJK_039472 [Asimina triloba]